MSEVEHRPATLRNRKNARLAVDKWQPTQWKPEYEMIVSMHVRGKTNIEIAKLTNYSEMQISNILTCEHAKVVKDEIIKSLRQDSKDIMEKIGKKAIERIEKLMDNDELFENSPFGVVDRAMSFLKGVNKLAGDGPVTNNNTQNNTLVIGDEIAERLVAGLEKANEAAKLNAGLSGESVN